MYSVEGKKNSFPGGSLNESLRQQDVVGRAAAEAAITDLVDELLLPSVSSTSSYSSSVATSAFDGALSGPPPQSAAELLIEAAVEPYVLEQFQLSESSQSALLQGPLVAPVVTATAPI
jgi:hypothetical protein